MYIKYTTFIGNKYGVNLAYRTVGAVMTPMSRIRHQLRG